MGPQHKQEEEKKCDCYVLGYVLTRGGFPESNSVLTLSPSDETQ